MLSFLDQGRSHVATVINDDIGFAIQGNLDVAMIGFVVFPFDGENGNAFVFNQAGSNVVLSGKGVAGDQDGISAPSFERDRKVCCFRCYMATSDQANTSLKRGSARARGLPLTRLRALRLASLGLSSSWAMAVGRGYRPSGRCFSLARWR